MATARTARITVYVTPETQQALAALKTRLGVKKNSDAMNTLLLRAIQEQEDPLRKELKVIKHMLRLLIAGSIEPKHLAEVMHAIELNISPADHLIDYAIADL